MASNKDDECVVETIEGETEYKVGYIVLNFIVTLIVGGYLLYLFINSITIKNNQVIQNNEIIHLDDFFNETNIKHYYWLPSSNYIITFLKMFFLSCPDFNSKILVLV